VNPRQEWTFASRNAGHRDEAGCVMPSVDLGHDRRRGHALGLFRRSRSANPYAATVSSPRSEQSRGRNNREVGTIGALVLNVLDLGDVWLCAGRRVGVGGIRVRTVSLSSSSARCLVAVDDCVIVLCRVAAGIRGAGPRDVVVSPADDLPGRAYRVPVPAVVVFALSGGVAGIGVAEVGVQRPAPVGDDALAIGGQHGT
jgi:hypothetical protein